MPVIYLDQAFHGKDRDPGIQAALEFVRETSRAGTHVYPLSAVHYMETNRVRERGRRYRLGSAMWSLSCGRTISLGRKLLVREIEEALAQRFHGVTPTPFQLLGRGVAFAFDEPPTDFQISPRAYELHSAAHIEAVKQAALERFERSCLTGDGPDGEMMAPMPSSNHARNFMDFLSTLGSRFSVITTKQWGDGLSAVSIVDILEPLEATLAAHGLSLDQLLALGKEGISSFMQDLPSRRVDMHLQHQVLRNPPLRPKPTDLEDWAALGPAAAHCDALLCEKHFASLLARDAFASRAQVFTNLADLPRAFGAA